MSTHFTMWCNPKAFKLSSTTLFSGLAGGYCAISSDQRQDGDRLAEPQNAVCDATSALSTRGEILSKGCSCQTAEMELRTIANILHSLAHAENQYLAFSNKTLPKSFQYSYQFGFIHIEKISTIFSIRKKEVWCQRKTMRISIWRTEAVLCEACAGYVAAGGLYRKPSAVKTKKYKGKNHICEMWPGAKLSLKIKGIVNLHQQMGLLMQIVPIP